MTKSEQKPPRAAAALLRRCSPGYRRESAEGDYEEIFSELADRQGLQHARRWYWGQALQSLILAFFWRGIMLHNYLKVTWRQFVRHKGYSIINITGLALGITCCILIILWIQDETSWDGFHAYRNDLYLIVQKQPNGHRTPVTPYALSGYLKQEYPEVIQTGRYITYGKIQISHGRTILSDQLIAADPSFFSMFSFPFIEGDAKTAFNDTQSIILTRETSRKLFGESEALGRTVLLNNRTAMMVTGIVENPPIQSSIRFQSVIPLHLIT
ncbi:MAG: ABC transporter permease [Candidatus Aminicenantes bacterium]|nr:ABC transporter permease [Candidatus Aminicenantes bacterium]